jgi:putative ABC transport system permease protein
LFVQSLALGLLGTAGGLAVAPFGVGILLSILPPDVPRVTSIHVDGPVLAVTTAVAMLATLAFGTVGAVQGRKSAVLSLVAETAGGQRTTARHGGGTLTAVEMAMAVTLGVMALLMVRTVAGLRSVDLGFNPGGVALARLALPEDRYASGASQRIFFERLLDRVRSIPGVATAGVVSTRPLGGLGPATTVTAPNQPPASGVPSPVADVRVADAAAFHALRVPLLSGRLFDDAKQGDPAEAIISRSLARTFWPGRNAVGEKLTLAMYGTLTADVIGVVDDVHLMDPRTPVRPTVYLSAARFTSPVRDLVVRMDAAPESAIPLLRSAVAALDSSLPLYAVTTLPDLVDTALASERFTMCVLIAFAISALFLAAIGVFGVFVGDVRRRRREIGIRLALGASESRIVRMLLRKSLQSAAAGIAAGIGLAALLARMMTQLLFGVGPTDPLSLAAVASLVLAVAVVATLLPALRAIRQSALAALREG